MPLKYWPATRTIFTRQAFTLSNKFANVLREEDRDEAANRIGQRIYEALGEDPRIEPAAEEAAGSSRPRDLGPSSGSGPENRKGVPAESARARRTGATLGSGLGGLQEALNQFNAMRKDDTLVRKQFRAIHLQRNRERFDIVDRNISLAAFDRAYVSSVKSREFCKTLLAEIPGLACAAEVPGKYKSR